MKRFDYIMLVVWILIGIGNLLTDISTMDYVVLWLMLIFELIDNLTDN